MRGQGSFFSSNHFLLRFFRYREDEYAQLIPISYPLNTVALSTSEFDQGQFSVNAQNTCA